MENYEELKKTFIHYCLGLCDENKTKSLLSEELVADFLIWANKNKLLPTAYELVFKEKNIKLVDHNHDDAYSIDMIYARYIKRREIIIKDTSELMTFARDRNIPLLTMKGLVTEQFYPTYFSRQTNDMDFVINNESELWPFLNKSLSENFSHSLLPKIRNSNGDLIGLFKMGKEEISSPYGELYREFNLGGFTITDITHIPSDVLFTGAKEMLIENTKVLVPSMSKQLLLIFVELVTREKIFVRDALDFLVLLRNSSEDDINELKVLIKEYSLQNESSRLMCFVRKLGIDLSFISDFQHAFIMNYFPENFEEYNNIRCYRHHILPILQKQQGKKGLINALYFRRRERLGEKLNFENEEITYTKRLVDLGQKYTNPYEQYQEGHHVYLVYINNKIKGEWKHFKLEGFHFLKTPTGVYWLSQEAIEPEEIYLQTEILVENLL